MCGWSSVGASCVAVCPFLYLVQSPMFVAGLLSNWVILQLGCNNIHCDTRGGRGLLTSDDQEGGGSMIVCECVFSSQCFRMPWFLRDTHGLLGLRSGVFVRATDCYKSCWPVITVHKPKFFVFHLFVFCYSHDMSSAFVPCTKTVWLSWTFRKLWLFCCFFLKPNEETVLAFKSDHIYPWSTIIYI